MASNINPTIIDGTYPIPAQDNDSQGFRDNFTNTRNNFGHAKAELEDLQSKAIVNAQLSVSGAAPSNNMNNQPFHNAIVRNIKERTVAVAETSGAIVLDVSAAHYQRLSAPTTGSVTLTLNSWPAVNQHGRLRFEINVGNIAHTLTLPNTVYASRKVPGLAGNTITFKNTGVHVFEFYSRNGGSTIGIVDFTQPETPAGMLSLWPNNTTVPAGWAATGQTVAVVPAGTLYVIQRI